VGPLGHPGAEAVDVGDVHQREPGAIRNVWKPAVAAAGLKAKAVFHDLRHTHATWLAGSPDFDIERLRQRMGHKSIITTQRYISASEDVDPDGADILDEMLAAPRRRRGHGGLTAIS
jgi:integrase